MNWKGVIPAITTSFTEHLHVDHGAVMKHCRWLLDHGCAGIVALGSLGEGATLSFDEKTEILRTCVDAAINGNTIVAGAQKRNNDTGLAYVFVKPTSGWKNMTQTGELSASGLAVGDFFGNGVAVSPAKIAIGSVTTSTAGTAYAYNEPSAGWKSSLPASEGTVTGGEYGCPVAISGSVLGAGAPANGVAYVFGP